MYFNAEPDAPREIERLLRIYDAVLRFLIVVAEGNFVPTGRRTLLEEETAEKAAESAPEEVEEGADESEAPGADAPEEAASEAEPEQNTEEVPEETPADES